MAITHLSLREIRLREEKRFTPRTQLVLWVTSCQTDVVVKQVSLI